MQTAAHAVLCCCSSFENEYFVCGECDERGCLIGRALPHRSASVRVSVSVRLCAFVLGVRKGKYMWI